MDRDPIDEELWTRFLSANDGHAYPAQGYIAALREAVLAGQDLRTVPVPARLQWVKGHDTQQMVPMIDADTVDHLRYNVAAHWNPAKESITTCTACDTRVVPGRRYCVVHQPVVEAPFTGAPQTVEAARLVVRQAQEADALAPSAQTRHWRAQAQDWLAGFLLRGGGTSGLRTAKESR